MSETREIEGGFENCSGRFVIVAARFNAFIVDSLVEGARDALRRQGIADGDVTLVRAPGAYELPLVVRRAIDTLNPDGVIALGAVIRGSTPHFDYVAGECASGINRVSLDTGVPVAFGVLTTDTIEQAIERAGTKAGNKGAEAAMTALEMTDLLRMLDGAG